jgi:hypothetical protein
LGPTFRSEEILGVGETKEAKVRRVRIGTRKDMAQEMVLRIYFFAKCSPAALTKQLDLGQDGEKKRCKRDGKAHISSAFSTQLELGISDPIGK